MTARRLASLLLLLVAAAPPRSPPPRSAPAPERAVTELEQRAVAAAEASAAWAFWQLVVSVAGIAGIAATLWFNHRALRLAREGGVDTAEALRLAAINAEAATRLARIADETRVAQLRPWLLLDAVDLDVIDPHHWQVSVRLKNSGQTPALNVSIVVAWQAFDLDPSGAYPHDVAITPPETLSSALGAGDAIRGPAIDTAPADLVQRRLSVICETRYRDALSDVPHRTRFRVIVEAVWLHAGAVARWNVVGPMVTS